MKSKIKEALRLSLPDYGQGSLDDKLGGKGFIRGYGARILGQLLKKDQRIYDGSEVNNNNNQPPPFPLLDYGLGSLNNKLRGKGYIDSFVEQGDCLLEL